MRSSIALPLAALLTACTSRVGDLTLVSTRNLERPYTTVARGVTGKDCAHLLLFLPLGSLDLSLQEATDAAIRDATTGDMLVNVSVYRDFLYLLLYNRACIRVTGDVAESSSRNGAESGPEPPAPSAPPPKPLPTPLPKSTGVLEKVQ